MKLSKMSLIGGGSIPIDGICTLKPIKLSEIRSEKGYREFLLALGTISVNIENFSESLGLKNFSFPKGISLFDRFYTFPSLRQQLKEALSFFIEEEIREIKEDSWCFGVYGENEEIPKAIIYGENYEKIRTAIMQMNFLKVENAEIEDLKFASEKARYVYEEIQKRKNKTQKHQKNNPNINIPNLIAAVSARSGTYNLLNIWELTIYQLHDQFLRIDKNTNIDIAGAPMLMFGDNAYHSDFWYEDY